MFEDFPKSPSMLIGAIMGIILVLVFVGSVASIIVGVHKASNTGVDLPAPRPEAESSVLTGKHRIEVIYIDLGQSTCFILWRKHDNGTETMAGFSCK